MKQRSVYLFALTAILMWSTAGTAFKLALNGLGFIQLLFVASTFAWIFLFIVLAVRGRLREVLRSTPLELAKSALGGFLNPFLYYMVLLYAYSLLPAQIAGPLNYSWPVMLVLLSIPLLGQRLKAIELVAILVSFTGVIFISSQGSNIFTTPVNQPAGVILALSSSVIWALFWIYNVKDKRPEINKIALNFLFGSLFTGLAMLVSANRFEVNISLVPAVYVGLTEMAIAFVCWLTALENTSHNARIANLVFISPFIGLILIHLVLKEDIYWTTPVGLIFIVGGILIQQLLPAKLQKR